MNNPTSTAIADCREGLRILGTAEHVSYEIAHHFIQHTAFWDHPSGSWVRAPKHADRLEEGEHGWEVPFGANRFLVARALRFCIGDVECFLREVEIDERPSYSWLCYELRQCVRGSVGNHLGDIYGGRYPEHGDFMLFGTQGIHLPSFVQIVVLTARLPRHFEKT